MLLARRGELDEASLRRVLHQLLRLRQACCHPQVIDINDNINENNNNNNNNNNTNTNNNHNNNNNNNNAQF